MWIHSKLTTSSTLKKALQHKIDAANRQDIKYDVTGGGHRITLNTGTYELVKNAIPAFYEDHKDYSASVRPHVELKNRIVDIMVVVNNLKTGRKTFVINLYNTTSLILVNGKSPNIFRKHLDEIMKSISGEDVSNIHDVLNQVRRSNRDKKPSAKMRELQQSPPKKTSAKRKSNKVHRQKEQYFFFFFHYISRCLKSPRMVKSQRDVTLYLYLIQSIVHQLHL